MRMYRVFEPFDPLVTYKLPLPNAIPVGVDTAVAKTLTRALVVALNSTTWLVAALLTKRSTLGPITNPVSWFTVPDSIVLT